jgi:hypothetical protein
MMLAALLLAYRPFLDPLPIWRLPQWLWTPVLLIPLTVGIAIVYKSIKCRTMAKVPKESAELTGWILLFMLVAAIVLTIAVRAIERAS